MPLIWHFSKMFCKNTHCIETLSDYEMTSLWAQVNTLRISCLCFVLWLLFEHLCLEEIGLSLTSELWLWRGVYECCWVVNHVKSFQLASDESDDTEAELNHVWNEKTKDCGAHLSHHITPLCTHRSKTPTFQVLSPELLGSKTVTTHFLTNCN